MSLASLRSRLARFSECDPTPRAVLLSSSQEPVRKKRLGRGSRHSVTRELMLAHPSRASLSPLREASPVLFSHPDQRRPAAASDLVSFGGTDRRGLHLRSPPAAAWTNGFCRGAGIPLVNDLCHSSRRSTMRSQSRGAPPTPSSIDGAEEKGYDRLPPLDKSVAVHLCPPTAIGWKAKAAHPSKPCRTTSGIAYGL
ncbi:hypothetical protein Q8A67_025765 [Cirrhinus molitorella]|uniref:Uncharacterized protein n=1 Tax=Cirrhinus molitorella TaxID=172907 RepID=A0AA88P901_9TELE|nr:hypothetical protein Q8A67_025765 [Cirrhinus molitorella]